MINDNKRIAVNSVIIFVRVCIVAVVGILTSRIVLDALGASDFGLYSVVGGVVALLSVFNTAMTTTTFRFIAYELGKADGGNPNKVFNIVFIIHVLFALLMLLLCFTVGFWYIDNYLNIAVEKISDARFVFVISTFTAAMSTMMVPYMGLLTAFENFIVTAFIDIASALIKLLLLYLFVYSDGSRIRTYSLIMLFYFIIYNGSFFVYCLIKYYRIVKFRIYRDSQLLKQIFSFTFWILFGAGASILQTQGTNIIVNLFFGTIANAGFAIANTVKNFITMFSDNLGRAAVPQITKSFSAGSENRSITLSCYISKYTCILMLVAAFPIIMEMSFLLQLWLKEVPENAVLYCCLTLLVALGESLGSGIHSLISASGNIRFFQLIQSILTVLGLPIAYFVYKIGAPAYSILIVFAIITFIKVLTRLVLIKYVLGYRIFPFLQISYLKILYISIPLLVAYLLYDPSIFSTFGHVAGMILSELFLVAVVLLFGLDKKEWSIIKNLYHNKIRIF